MSIKFRDLHGWWIVPLLSVASLASPSNDFRLAEAVKKGDKQASAFAAGETGGCEYTRGRRHNRLGLGSPPG